MKGGVLIKKTGFIEAILSAVIFGSMPLLTKILYSFGADFISTAFYRCFIPLIFIFLYEKYILKYSLKITKDELLHYLICAMPFAFTMLTLFNSYNFISSGAATSIHFIYPVIIFLTTSILSSQRPRAIETLCIIMSFLGLFIITDFKEMSSLDGIIFALVSAFTFAAYSLYLERSTIINSMQPLKTLFYLNLFSSLIILIYALITRTPIHTGFEPKQWLVVFIYSTLITVCAAFLYQRAIMQIGAKYTSMLSTLEPITSLILGFSILNEKLTNPQIFTIILIFSASFILIRSRQKEID